MSGLPTQEKLVRDLMPEIIRERGETPRFRIASPGELPALLLRKLREKTAELEKGPTYEVLADVVEVLAAIMDAHAVCQHELERTRLEKRGKNGGFKSGVVLELPAGTGGEGSPARRWVKMAATELLQRMGPTTLRIGSPPHLALAAEFVQAVLLLLEEEPQRVEDVRADARAELDRADAAVASAAAASAAARDQGRLSSEHAALLSVARLRREVLAETFARMGLVPAA